MEDAGSRSSRFELFTSLYFKSDMDDKENCLELPLFLSTREASKTVLSTDIRSLSKGFENRTNTVFETQLNMTNSTSYLNDSNVVFNTSPFNDALVRYDVFQ